MFNYFSLKLVHVIIFILLVSSGWGCDVSTGTQEKIQFIAFGDQGTGWKKQKLVAKAMHRKATEDPFDFVILLGDNFYFHGVESVDDPQWNAKFEKMYSYPSLDVPFYAVLGNHGYWGNPLAQVQYTKKSLRWTMPDNYYTFNYRIGDSCEIQFFALDTTPIVRKKKGYKNQINWLDEQLRASKAHWKIVYGHHFVFSSGKYGTNKHMVKVLAPIFQKYRIDLYMSGHDHDKELIKSDADIYYMVSGAASMPRPIRGGKKTLFASSKLGFAWMKITKNELFIQFISADNDVEYEHTIEKIWRDEQEG